MRTIWHLVWKDTRHQAALLAAWATVLLLLALLAASGLDAAATTSDELARMDYARTILLWIAAPLFVVLAVRAVQADPLVGTTAFWQTRPIAPAALLSAKLLFTVLALVLIPLAVGGAALASHGLWDREVLAHVAWTLALQLAMLLAVMALASITSSLAQWALAAAAALIALWLALYGTLLATRGLHLPLGVLPEAYRERMFVGLVIAASLVAVAHQYLTRRRLASTMFAGAAALLTVPIIIAWPSDLADQLGRHPPIDRRVLDPDAIRVTVDRSSLAFRRLPRGQRALVCDLAIHGLPPAVIVESVGSRSVLGYGAVTMDDTSGTWLRAGADNERRRHAIEHAVGGAALVSAPPHRQTQPVLFTLDEAELKRHRAQPGTLTSELVLSATVFRAAGEVPLQTGTTWRIPGRHGRVLRTEVQPERWEAVVREAGVDLQAANGQDSRVMYILRNHALGEAVVALASGSGPFLLTGATPAAQLLSVRHTTVAVGDWRPAGSGALQDWIDGAELVMVDLVDAGSFVKRIEIPNLVLADLPGIER